MLRHALHPLRSDLLGGWTAGAVLAVHPVPMDEPIDSGPAVVVVTPAWADDPDIARLVDEANAG